VTRSARDRLIDIQAAIAKIHEYRRALRGEHSGMAVSAIRADEIHGPVSCRPQ
jgi:hypothetical protein